MCVCVHTCVCLCVYVCIYRCMCTHANTHLQMMERRVRDLAAAKDFAALVALMREHPADPVVARAVCEVFHDKALDDANRQAIGAAGGAEVVVLALKQHLAVAWLA